MKIWAHTLVRNEERYLWFSVMSVIEHVDRILLWDTASTDKTIEIIKLIKKKYPEKIDFRQLGDVNPEKFTLFRQEMLNETKSDWFIIVDGDEVWWDEKIKETVELIYKEGKNLDSVVTKYTNIIGDIYHYQEETAGKYKIDGVMGHLTIRAIRKTIPGIHFSRPHGIQAILDENEVPVQERTQDKRMVVEGRSYLHFTHMVRSSTQDENLKVMKRDLKVKHELGHRFPNDYYYPEVFFKPTPEIIQSPWERMNRRYFLRSVWETPLRKVKRRLIRGKSGY